jgi:hypothetical protein
VLSRATQTTFGRLGLLVSTVALVVLGSAALAHVVFGLFDNFGAALWSAVLHLLDPSSLHDDSGAEERIVGLIQAVTGLVLLVGVLFTLVAESVGSSIERLGRHDPPVHAHGHVLIVGGGDFLAPAAEALAIATEVGGHRERVVFLAPESARSSRRRLLTELRKRAGRMKVSLVIGETGEESGFELGAAAAAAVILVLPTGSGPVIAEAADVEVMQTGLALSEYLEPRGADPDVRLLFRRGRNVDAVWDMMPAGWDAVVGDRVVSSTLRHAITGFGGISDLEALVDPYETGADVGAPHRAWERAGAEGRALRLTLIGCGINTPALLEDLAEAGAERFEVTVLAARGPYDTYLGRPERAGLELRYEEISPADPERLRQALERANPEVAVVSPSPTSWDLRDSDAEATMALLHVLRILGAETPALAELFLPSSVERLPAERRLLPVSGLQAVSGALALTVFNPERAAELEGALEAEEKRQGR